MRVTFPRLPDHQRAYALVERDDGVVYRLYGGVAGSRLPHDIMHLIAERELRIEDGLWAGIAAGVVFESMCHVSGRRPPHAAEHSRDLLRRFSQQGLRAELLADLVASVAALETTTQDKIRQLTRDKLAVLPAPPPTGPPAGPPAGKLDPVVIAAAARALQVEAARWARLRVGEELNYEWPGN